MERSLGAAFEGNRDVFRNHKCDNQMDSGQMHRVLIVNLMKA